MDHLGRPLLYQSSWRECRGRARASAAMAGGWDEQRRRRVESYLRNSPMSMVRAARGGGGDQGGLGGVVSWLEKIGQPNR